MLPLLTQAAPLACVCNGDNGHKFMKDLKHVNELRLFHRGIPKVCNLWNWVHLFHRVAAVSASFGRIGRVFLKVQIRPDIYAPNRYGHMNLLRQHRIPANPCWVSAGVPGFSALPSASGCRSLPGPGPHPSPLLGLAAAEPGRAQAGGGGGAVHAATQQTGASAVPWNLPPLSATVSNNPETQSQATSSVLFLVDTCLLCMAWRGMT